MTIDAVIQALDLPAHTRLDQRVPKSMLADYAGFTSADRKLIHDGIEQLLWIAALKPTGIGVPAYRDTAREYLEIAVLSLALRQGAKASRLIELIHRAIPYPVLLINASPGGVSLSLAHLRWSQGQSGQTVLDGQLMTADVSGDTPALKDFYASLALPGLPREHLYALYQGWVERFEAYSAATHTGKFAVIADPVAIERRRVALASHERISCEIAGLRTAAEKETQLNRRVEINLQLKQLQARLAEASAHL